MVTLRTFMTTMENSFPLWRDKRGKFKATTDRIEGCTAVLLVRDEESVRIKIPLFLLPAESKEGDILDITIARDVQETEDSKERVSNLLEKLRAKDRTFK
jgi:hypothetical protein